MPRSVRWPVLTIFTVLTVVPFLWLLMSSLKISAEIFANPFGLPHEFSLANFTDAWKAHPLGLYLRNSILVSLISTVLIIGASLLAAYALMYRFRLAKPVFAVLVFGLLLPVNALLVPIFYIVSDLRLYNSVWGVALTYAGIFFPTGFLVIKGFMDTTPEEILEAARVDGASFHRVFRSIVAPLTMPGIVTAAIFLLITTWNELLFATVLTQDEKAQTVQVGVRFFLTTYAANYPQAFAATVMSIAPTIVVYVLLSNRVIGGMTAGSIK